MRASEAWTWSLDAQLQDRSYSLNVQYTLYGRCSVSNSPALEARRHSHIETGPGLILRHRRLLAAGRARRAICRLA
jgi:hypothetical protein